MGVRVPMMARGGRVHMADGGDPDYSIDPGLSPPAQAPAWPGDAGSGTAPQGDEHSQALQDVNRMFKEFEQMQDMMKKMQGGGLMKMMKKLGGMKGMGGMGGGGFPGMR